MGSDGIVISLIGFIPENNCYSGSIVSEAVLPVRSSTGEWLEHYSS